MEALDIVVLLLIAYQGALDTCCPSRPADCVDLVCCAVESWLDQRQRRLRPSGPIAPIQTLPAEILQMVFEHAAAELADTHDAVNMELIPALMATCTKFRAVALETPFLWSFVTFKWFKPRRCASGDLEIFSRSDISLRLERSKQTAFHLLVLLRKEDIINLFVPVPGIYLPDAPWVDRSMDQLKQLLLPHMHRCCKVEVVNGEPSAWLELLLVQCPQFFPLTENMPKLRTIIHDGGRDGGGDLFGPDVYAPALQTVVCRNAPLFIPISFPIPVGALSSLTTLEIQSPEASRLGTLIECAKLPMLQHLRLRFYNRDWSATDEKQVDTIHFPELRVLALDGAASCFSITQISAPHLRILDISNRSTLPSFLAGSHFPVLETFNLWTSDCEDFEFACRHRTLSIHAANVTWLGAEDWALFFASQSERDDPPPLLLRCYSTPNPNRKKGIKALVRHLRSVEHIRVEWIDSVQREASSVVDQSLLSSSRWKWSTGRAVDDATEAIFKC